MSKTKKVLSVALVCILATSILSSCNFINSLFSKEKYTVTFVKDGVAEWVFEVKKGEKTVVPYVAKDGYTFIGWFYDGDMTREFDLETKITSNIVLEAAFNANIYRLTAKKQTPGGEISFPNQNCATDTQTSVNATIESDLYFAGWYEGDILRSSNLIYGFNMPPRDIELRAVYTDDGKRGESVLTGDNFASGTGIYEDPYIISNAEELAYLAELVNNGNEDLSYGNYALSGDIDLRGADWTPVGNGAHAFMGKFDGRGYEISNFVIEAEGDGYLGLFGAVDGIARIENLGVTNARISVVASKAVYAGAVVGRLLGYSNPGSADTGMLAGLYSSGSIIVESAAGDVYAGGLIGKSEDIAEAKYNYLARSYSTAKVAVKATSATGNAYAGGVIGYTNIHMIDGIFAVGDVTSESVNQSAYAGGIAGYYKGGSLSNVMRLERMFASGNITVKTENGRGYAGSITGNTAGRPVTTATVCRYFKQTFETVGPAQVNRHENSITEWHLTAKQLFISSLDFDERYWNLDGLDFVRGIIPTLK
ncbi:MAG: InlB B-repeat-containing protein [Clostridiales bacterium]|nr:InlB B-repeat-containing protein [Clostridiales bacterium]